LREGVGGVAHAAGWVLVPTIAFILIDEEDLQIIGRAEG
jgi:hypothetical protein